MVLERGEMLMLLKVDRIEKTIERRIYRVFYEGVREGKIKRELVDVYL